MPIGNGDVGLNVWVDPTGGLLFHVAKSDAMSENGEFLKRGRARATLVPPLPVGTPFTQHPSLGDGAIAVKGGRGPIRQNRWLGWGPPP